MTGLSQSMFLEVVVLSVGEVPSESSGHFHPEWHNHCGPLVFGGGGLAIPRGAKATTAACCHLSATSSLPVSVDERVLP